MTLKRAVQGVPMPLIPQDIPPSLKAYLEALHLYLREVEDKLTGLNIENSIKVELGKSLVP